MNYFLPLFCSYLGQISGDPAKNFATVSLLQPQHMLQISAHLYCPGMRSIFEGEGCLKMIKSLHEHDHLCVVKRAFLYMQS